MKPKIILAGGSGFLGKVLVQHLQRHFDFVILCRDSNSIQKNPNATYLKWDAKTIGDWISEFENAKAVINLTGKSVDCRYNEKNKREIIRSRIDSTNVIGEAMKLCKHPPAIWINAASATIYRHAEDRDMDEFTDEFGSGFSVDVCKQWEATFNSFDIQGIRKICIRISMVFGKDGGVFPVLKRLTKFGLGGKMGNGNQYVSWIHENDFANAILFLIENKNIKGVFNISTPNPLPNKELMKLFRNQLKIPIGLPAPKWMLEVGAFFLRTETELILKSRRVVPANLLKNGFKFEFENALSALKNLLHP